MSEPLHDAEKIMRRVRGLLAKAEQTEYPAEAEAFTAQAAAIMAKYGIEQAMLGDKAPTDDRPESRRFEVPAPYASSKTLMLDGLARALRCHAVRVNRGQTEVVMVYGFRSDLVQLDVLFTSLLLQAHHLLTRLSTPHRQGVKAYRRSWLCGFGVGVTERVAAAQKAAADQVEQETGASTALVLADRKAIAEREAAEAHPGIRFARVTFTGQGYQKGRMDAQTANIGQTGLGTPNRAAIGR